jgi:protein SCO1/2
MRTVAVTLALFAAACGSPADVGLPYYSEATFTPAWTESAPRDTSFALLDQRGEPFTDGDVEGQVYVASFIYTRCSAVCPLLVQSLSRVDAALQSTGVRLVSFSVTPETDSPQVLSAFGDERSIDPVRWRLVTGDRARIFALAREFYFADDGRFADTAYDFLHTEKVVLVDRHGRLRGVYNGTLAADIDRLIGDAGWLAATTQ